MPAFNTAPPAVTITDTAAHVVMPDQDLMADPKQLNSNVGLHLSTLTGSTLAGAWKIEASNNSHQGSLARWADITAGFSPAIAAVASGASDQFVQLSIYGRAIRVSFTATSGSGDAAAAICAQPAIPPASGIGV